MNRINSSLSMVLEALDLAIEALKTIESEIESSGAVEIFWISDGQSAARRIDSLRYDIGEIARRWQP